MQRSRQVRASVMEEVGRVATEVPYQEVGALIVTIEASDPAPSHTEYG